MSMLKRARRWTRARLRWRGDDAEPARADAPPRQVDVRITAGLFGRVRRHVEDFSRGEEAGFLLCSLNRLDAVDILLAREWVPVPERALRRNDAGSVLSWSADFNSEVTQRALDLDAAAILVHSHGGPRPVFLPMTAPRNARCSDR